MIRTVAFFFHMCVLLVITSPALLRVKYLEKKGRLKERDKCVHDVTSWWAKSLIWMSGSKIKVVGHENIPQDKPVVFISNHQGDFDILIFMAYINKFKGFIAKIETRKLPIISSWMKNMKCVFMDRKNIRQSVEAINQGVEYVKKGYSTVIFPEGTRSRGDKMNEFKAGSFKLATKAGAPIIPITVKGSYRMFEANGRLIRPADVEIVISPPIETQNLSREELNELPERVRGIIAENL